MPGCNPFAAAGQEASLPDKAGCLDDAENADDYVARSSKMENQCRSSIDGNQYIGYHCSSLFDN